MHDRKCFEKKCINILLPLILAMPTNELFYAKTLPVSFCSLKFKKITWSCVQVSVFHLDIFWNVKAFLTKLGVIVLDRDLESHSKCFCCCGWGPGDGLELQGSPLSSQLLNHSGHLMYVSHKDQCNNLTRSKSLMNTHHPCHMSLYMWRELKRWSSENWESQNWSSWSQSVGEACKIIYWPTLGLKLRTFGRSRFSVEGAFNCASAVPHSRISRQTWSVCTTWGQSIVWAVWSTVLWGQNH